MNNTTTNGSISFSYANATSTTPIELNYKVEKSPYEQLPENIFDMLELEQLGVGQPEKQPDYLFVKPVEWYTQAVKNHKILDRHTTLKLLEAAVTGDLGARDILMTHNQRLALSIANDYKFVLYETDAIEFKDLVQEGILGLDRAIMGFDVSKGNTLSTYATWWIQQCVSRAIGDYKLTIRLPVYINEKLGKYRKATAKLENKLERLPSIDELAEELDLTYEQVFLLDQLYYRKYLSTDDSAFNNEDSDSCFGDFIEDTQIVLPHIATNRRMLKEKIRMRLKVNLSIKEYQIIDARFGLTDERPLTLEAVAEKFLVTRERIRQIQVIALGRLKVDPVIRKLVQETLGIELPMLTQAELQLAATGQTDSVKAVKNGSMSWFDADVTSKPDKPVKEVRVKEPIVREAKQKEPVIKVGKKDSLVSEVAQILEKFYELPKNLIFIETENMDALVAQRVAIYILAEYYKLSTNVIARNFEKDNGRIMTASNRVKIALMKDEGLKLELQTILGELSTLSQTNPLLKY